MMIFARGRDLAARVELYSKAILAMASDMERICEASGCAYTKEAIMESYIEAEEGPNAFERVLIDKGDLSEAEVKRNFLAEDICRTVEEIAEDIRFYMVPMTDEEFQKDVASMPGVRVYALHNRKEGEEL